MLQLGKLALGGLARQRRAQRLGGFGVIGSSVDLLALLLEIPHVEHLAAGQHALGFEQVEQRLTQQEGGQTGTLSSSTVCRRSMSSAGAPRSSSMRNR